MPVRTPLQYDQKWASRTDPEPGHLNRPGKPKGPHYLSHQTVDCKHGLILNVADAAYDLPLFHRGLQDHGIRFYVRPMPRSAAALGRVPRSPFLYDKENDLYTCHGGKTLHLRNLNRNVGGLHWVYFADRSDCAACSMRGQCVGKGRVKRLEHNYFWRDVRENLRKLDSPTYQRSLRKR